MATIGSLAVVLSANTQGLVSGLSGGVKAVGSFVGAIGKTVSRASGAVSGGMSRIGSVLDPTNYLGGSLLLRGIDAVTGGIGGAVRQGVNFEQMMSNVRALTGATGPQFETLTDRALELGRTSAYTATNAAEAMKLFAQGGLSVNEILEATGPALALAAAGELELAEAAEITTKVMRGFGISASQVSGVADMLAFAANRSSTDVRGIGEAMKFVASTAKMSGMGLADTSAAVMALVNVGQDAEMAGTGLRGILNAMSNPTGEAAAELRKLELTFYDLGGRMKPLPQIVDEFSAKLGTMTQQDAARAIDTLFEARAGNAFRALLNTGGKSLLEFQRQLENAGGTAQFVANEKLNNVAGAWRMFQSALEGVNIALFYIIRGPMRGIIDWMTGHLTTLQKWLAEIVKFAPAIWAQLSNIGQAILGLAAPLVESLRSVFAGLIPDAGGWEGFRDGLLKALVVVEFLITNWEKGLEFLKLSAKLAFVQIGQGLIAAFKASIPVVVQLVSGLVKIIGSLFSSIFSNMVANVGTIAKNIGLIMIGQFDSTEFLKPLIGDVDPAQVAKLMEGTDPMSGLYDVWATDLKQKRDALFGDDFQATLQSRMGELLGKLKTPDTKTQPSGALGNLGAPAWSLNLPGLIQQALRPFGQGGVGGWIDRQIDATPKTAELKLAGVAEMGSRDALSSIAQFRAGAETEGTGKAQVQQLKEANKNLQKVAGAVVDLARQVVPVKILNF